MPMLDAFDRRLVSTMRGAPNWAIFIAAALCEQLGPKKVEAVLNKFENKSPDWSRKFGDAQLMHYNGKSQRRIREEAGEEVAQEIFDYLASFNIRLPEIDEQEQAAIEKANALRASLGNAPTELPPPLASVGSGEKPQENGGAGPDQLPPEIGGFKTADLRGKPREELMKIAGMSPQAADLLANS